MSENNVIIKGIPLTCLESIKDENNYKNLLFGDSCVPKGKTGTAKGGTGECSIKCVKNLQSLPRDVVTLVYQKIDDENDKAFLATTSKALHEVYREISSKENPKIKIITMFNKIIESLKDYTGKAIVYFVFKYNGVPPISFEIHKHDDDKYCIIVDGTNPFDQDLGLHMQKGNLILRFSKLAIKIYNKDGTVMPVPDEYKTIVNEDLTLESMIGLLIDTGCMLDDADWAFWEGELQDSEFKQIEALKKAYRMFYSTRTMDGVTEVRVPPPNTTSTTGTQVTSDVLKERLQKHLQYHGYTKKMFFESYRLRLQHEDMTDDQRNKYNAILKAEEEEAKAKEAGEAREAAGGGKKTSKKVVERTVHNKEYIIVNKSKVFLKNIRGKYRYTDAQRTKVTLNM